MSKRKLVLPHEVYGSIIGFLSQEEAMKVIKIGSRLAPIALKYYPWKLHQERVCRVFSKENVRALAHNTSLSPDSLLECAMSKGVYDVVINIIKTKKIRAEVKNETLIQASKKGRLEIVKLLLLKGADPSYRENESLFVGLPNPKIVEELLKDPRTNPDSFSIYYDPNDIVEESIASLSPLETASSLNYVDTVKILLNYSKKYPKRKFSYRSLAYENSLNSASVNDNLELVKLLLKYIPKLEGYMWLLGSIDNENYDMLDVLLESDKVVLMKENVERLIEYVTDNEDTKALKRLLQDPRFKGTLTKIL